MKKIVLLIALLVAGFSMNAQSQEAYIKAMTKGLEAMGSAQSQEDRVAVASQFERIAAKVKDQWQAQYYAGLSYVMLSFNAADLETNDSYTAKAQEFIDAALKLAPNSAEIEALQGYNYMAQLAADPNSRGQRLSPKAMQHFGKALSLDGENPRALALMAQMKYGMAQFFNAPTDEACDMVKKSLPIFDAEAKAESFDPTWGKSMAEGLVGQCNQ